jgi:hypothetical protein
MRWTRSAAVGWIATRLARLRFPTLFGITAALFVADLVVPDVIPFFDEILLGVAAALLGSWHAKRRPDAAPLSQPSPPPSPGPAHRP